MNNLITYKWQSQPYKSWKGDISQNLFNEVTTNYKRPVVNAVVTRGRGGVHRSTQYAATVDYDSNYQAPGRNSRVANSKNNKAKNLITTGIAGGVGARERNFGPNPIKHWRLQLNPDNASGYSKASVSKLMDQPGGGVVLKSSVNECQSCDLSQNSIYVKLYLDIHNKPNIPYSFPSDFFYDSSNNKSICVACNPENNIIKSAVTLLSKNYYSNNSSYLKSRCKSYEQRQSFNNKEVNKSKEEFQMLNCCYKTCNNKQVKPTTIYKPNNSQFQVQGAVSSSGRLAKLKYDTINKNGASFKSAYGAAAANAGKYRPSGNSGYFVKNKENKCQASIYHKNGNKNINCFLPMQKV